MQQGFPSISLRKGSKKEKEFIDEKRHSNRLLKIRKLRDLQIIHLIFLRA